MKTRIIKTEIHTDDIMLSLTPDVRSICKYLYCNSHIDLIDIYKIPVQLIQLETGYDITIIKLALDILQDKKIIQHYNHLWIKLIRQDFGALEYSGEKNDKAKLKYIELIPLEVKEFFDSSIDTSMHTSDKSEIINKKSKTINQESENQISSRKKTDIIKSIFEDNNITIASLLWENPNQRKGAIELYDSKGEERVRNLLSDIIAYKENLPKEKRQYVSDFSTPYNLCVNYEKLKNLLENQ